MKRLLFPTALLFLLALATAVWLVRPPPPDVGLFGAEMALPTELDPLVLARADLEVHGRVVTAAGEPAGDALVVFLPSGDGPGADSPLSHATTDPEGRFTARRLAPGDHRVVVSHPTAPPRTIELALPAEGELLLELDSPLTPLAVLPAIRRVVLTGRIRLPAGLANEGASLAGFDVALMPAKAPPFSGATERREATAADGGFRFEALVSAPYALQILPPWAGGGTWPVLATGEVDATAATLTPLEIELAVGALEGELQEADGRPLVGALGRLTSVAQLDPLGAPQLWPPMVTDDGGRYRADLLPPGRYKLHLRAGSALIDSEIEVLRGERTHVPRETMDLRGQAAPGG